MEGPFALKAQDQPARLGHLRRVIFDDIPRIQYRTHFPYRYPALEHALHCVEAKNDPGIVHQKIILV